MIVIHTDRLVLREFELSDAPFVYELLNSKGWIEFIGDRNIKSLEDARNYIAEKYIPPYSKPGPAMYLAELRSTGEAIGMCGLIQRPDLDHADIGYAFLPQFGGKGYAYEAGEAILQYASEDLKMENLLAIVTPDNQTSIKLLEKLDFSYKSMIERDGDNLMLFERRNN
jgi:[ribosomal protein S5]-alanine N-acetyltransferase